MKDQIKRGNHNRTRSRLKDLAEALDLSISTVSAAMLNRPDISSVTRSRVLRKAKQLNYQPNWLARSLAMNRTHVWGVILPDLSSSYFPEILNGIDSVARKSGYHLLVCNTASDASREDEEVATLLGKQVDGLIVASAHAPGDTKPWLSSKGVGVPVVLVDRVFPTAPCVAADNERIGYLATEHLIEQGYRNIAHLGRQSVVTGVGRRRGYVAALRGHGLRARRSHILEVQGELGGYEGAKRLLESRPRPDAVFAASDPIAIGAMRALCEVGVRIPADFGVIGVGRLAYGEFLRIPLSTIDQHPVDAGRSAATMLLGLIQGRPAPASAVLLTPTLVVRDSSSRLATKPFQPPDGPGASAVESCL